jgi:predicted metallopeptidase
MNFVSPRFFVNLLHQRLQRAPADLAQVAIVIRHELLAIHRTVNTNMRPPEIVIGLPEAAIAGKRRFRSDG